MVGVHHIGFIADGFRLIVQWQGFMLPCGERCKRMTTISAGIGHSHHVDDLNDTIFCSPHAHFPVPSMTTGRAVIGFMTIVNEVGWFL